MASRITGQPAAEGQMLPPVTPPATGYTGAPLQVGQQSVAFNPQSFVNSDAYNFIGQQGQQGIERRAGANGTLLTGGTLKDLTQFNQGNAATFWGQQLNHDTDMARINSGILEGNANRAVNGLSTLAGFGLAGAGGMANAYGNQGQAQAGGTYGGASAINNGVTNVSNTLGAWFANRKQPQPGTWTGLN